MSYELGKKKKINSNRTQCHMMKVFLYDNYPSNLLAFNRFWFKSKSSDLIVRYNVN